MGAHAIKAKDCKLFRGRRRAISRGRAAVTAWNLERQVAAPICPLLELPHSVFAWAGFAVFAGFFFLQWCMQIDVRCEADLDRYDQLFDNPALDTLFKADNGSGLFLQFCDRATVICVQTACFCKLLEVRDFYEEQEAREHPDRVPDPPVAWVTRGGCIGETPGA